MKKDWLSKIAGILCLLVGALSVLSGKFLSGIGILTIGLAVLYTSGGSSNDRNIYEKLIKSDLSIDEIFEKLRDVETPLGKPWLAGHKTYEGSNIVFGPSAFKDIVVVSKGKGGIVIRHSINTSEIIRSDEEEYRFEDVIKSDEEDVSPSRYSLFVGFKMASVELVRQLYDFILKLSENRDTEAAEEWGLFKFYYHNSSEGSFKDADGRDVLGVECAFDPFTARVLDEDGSEMASVKSRGVNKRGEVSEKDGFELIANGEHYGEITKLSDGFSVETEDGSFFMRQFPACGKANVSCNYRIEKDGKDVAIIGGSPNLSFGSKGRHQNDVILSYDDDYLVLYAILEIFVITYNRKFLK